jgi:GNAT superfamily N-acetyltransferase
VATDEWFEVTADLDRIDLAVVHKWLSTDAFWAIGRTREMVDLAAENSLNFGVIDRAGALRGYARVVTDRATFAWVCDVYVDPAARGVGLGVMLARSIVEHLRPLQLQRVVLSTRDAHGVYEKVGFVPLHEPHKWMLLADARG